MKGAEFPKLICRLDLGCGSQASIPIPPWVAMRVAVNICDYLDSTVRNSIGDKCLI
jgi:hypothetical protein